MASSCGVMGRRPYSGTIPPSLEVEGEHFLANPFLPAASISSISFPMSCSFYDAFASLVIDGIQENAAELHLKKQRTEIIYILVKACICLSTSHPVYQIHANTETGNHVDVGIDKFLYCTNKGLVPKDRRHCQNIRPPWTWQHLHISVSLHSNHRHLFPAQLKGVCKKHPATYLPVYTASMKNSAHPAHLSQRQENSSIH